jgi:hypothetical protein
MSDVAIWYNHFGSVESLLSWCFVCWYFYWLPTIFSTNWEIITCLISNPRPHTNWYEMDVQRQATFRDFLIQDARKLNMWWMNLDLKSINQPLRKPNPGFPPSWVIMHQENNSVSHYLSYVLGVNYWVIGEHLNP